MAWVMGTALVVLVVSGAIWYGTYRSSDARLAGPGSAILLGGALLLAGVGGRNLLAWRPTPGPYAFDTVYPLGSMLQSCVASLGADWVAFALLLGVAAVITAELQNKWFRVITVLSTAFVLFPYGANLGASLFHVTAPPAATTWEVALVAGTPLLFLAVTAVGWRRLYKSLERRPVRWRWWVALLGGIGSLLLAVNYSLMFSPTNGPYTWNAYGEGGAIQTCMSRFGYDWLGFWFLFVAVALAGRNTKWVFSALAWSAFLVWLPHAVIFASLIPTVFQ
jgi:hypothetical protein